MYITIVIYTNVTTDKNVFHQRFAHFLKLNIPNSTTENIVISITFVHTK